MIHEYKSLGIEICSHAYSQLSSKALMGTLTPNFQSTPHFWWLDNFVPTLSLPNTLICNQNN